MIILKGTIYHLHIEIYIRIVTIPRWPWTCGRLDYIDASATETAGTYMPITHRPNTHIYIPTWLYVRKRIPRKSRDDKQWNILETLTIINIYIYIICIYRTIFCSMCFIITNRVDCLSIRMCAKTPAEEPLQRLSHIRKLLSPQHHYYHHQYQYYSAFLTFISHPLHAISSVDMCVILSVFAFRWIREMDLILVLAIWLIRSNAIANIARTNEYIYIYNISQSHAIRVPHVFIYAAHASLLFFFCSPAQAIYNGAAFRMDFNSNSSHSHMKLW